MGPVHLQVPQRPCSPPACGPYTSHCLRSASPSPGLGRSAAPIPAGPCWPHETAQIGLASAVPSWVSPAQPDPAAELVVWPGALQRAAV